VLSACKLLMQCCCCACCLCVVSMLSMPPQHQPTHLSSVRVAQLVDPGAEPHEVVLQGGKAPGGQALGIRLVVARGGLWQRFGLGRWTRGEGVWERGGERQHRQEGTVSGGKGAGSNVVLQTASQSQGQLCFHSYAQHTEAQKGSLTWKPLLKMTMG
jgi:hypothetical protein